MIGRRAGNRSASWKENRGFGWCSGVYVIRGLLDMNLRCKV